MTKKQELKLLAVFIKKLGPDSYLGPLLDMHFGDFALRLFPDGSRHRG